MKNDNGEDFVSASLAVVADTPQREQEDAAEVSPFHKQEIQIEDSDRGKPISIKKLESQTSPGFNKNPDSDEVNIEGIACG